MGPAGEGRYWEAIYLVQLYEPKRHVLLHVTDERA